MCESADLLNTECVTDLDSQCEMIIFESILTPFEASSFFKAAAGAVVKSRSSLRITNFNQVSLPKSLIRTVCDSFLPVASHVTFRTSHVTFTNLSCNA